MFLKNRRFITRIGEFGTSYKPAAMALKYGWWVLDLNSGFGKPRLDS
ncbi:MAG: hypothetical protein ACE5KV_01970 [Thermoplasmata archaeon]